jgi:Uncharacterized protein conserved in bacteria
MTGKNKVEIRIAGKEYTIVGTESEEYIQKIGLYIDRKMNEVMRANNKLSTSMAAVLTSMNVADDFFKCHENESNFRKEAKRLQEELESLREEKNKISQEYLALKNSNADLKMELVKREAELREVRNSIEKASRNRP